MFKKQHGDYSSENSIDNEKDKKHDRRRDTISWHWALIFISLGCLLFYIIHLLDHDLPNPISAEEADANPHLFSAERARTSLRRLTALGPRAIGDVANEVYAPQLIEDEVNAAIRGAHPSQRIFVERQRGSGSFKRIERAQLAFTNIYIDIQNVIVKVEGSEGKHSILVNCHYDSLPEVDGASDDGISCAVMLEIIRVLAANKIRFKHNIVFLFNGAEEAGLHGSHLFLQHPWKEQCRIFVNLEAAGIGGRSILFQSGPNNPWLLKYYAKHAPHPHGMVLAEEIFQAGIIPSDTDFRIFDSYGKLSGYDFAFSRSGQLYHTKYDSVQYIPLGSYQHMGENTLALLKALGNAPELENENSEGKYVFFDYLGWFMVYYSAEAGIAINIVVILLGISSIGIFIGQMLKWSWLLRFTGAIKKLSWRKSSHSGSVDLSDIDDGHIESSKWTILKELSIAICARIVGLGLAVGVNAVVALIINSAAELAIPWYSNVWLLFPFYWCPCFVTYTLVPYLVDLWRSKKNNMSVSNRTHMNLMAAQIIVIIIFFALTVSGFRSAYIFLLQVFFTAIGNLIIYFTPVFLSTQKWIWIYLLFQMPAFIINLYLSLLLYVVYNPIIGRSGVGNGDLTIALVSSGLCLYVSSFISPLVITLRRSAIVFAVLTTFSIVMIIVALTTSIGHPYRAGPDTPRPQKYSIVHTLRELRNETGGLKISETGYFVLNLDENSPRTLPGRSKSNIRTLKEDCEEELYCGVPFYTTRTLPYSAESSWIPASRSYQPTETELILKNGAKNCSTNENLCEFSFQLKGPDRMTLTFSPRNGATLAGWNIDDDLETPLRFKNRPAYLIHIVRGRVEKDVDINLIFKVTREQLGSTPIIDIGLAGNHVHHGNFRTKDFQDFLDSMPDWTDRSGWISAYKGYIL